MSRTTRDRRARVVTLPAARGAGTGHARVLGPELRTLLEAASAPSAEVIVLDAEARRRMDPALDGALGWYRHARPLAVSRVREWYDSTSEWSGWESTS